MMVFKTSLRLDVIFPFILPRFAACRFLPAVWFQSKPTQPSVYPLLLFIDRSPETRKSAVQPTPPFPGGAEVE